jgi:hypothetical protein
MIVEPVPELVRATYWDAGAVDAQLAVPRLLVPPDCPVSETAVTVTWADDVKEPNRPNTNPAMAMAAMSVMAMSMTVAMTGEMAFLPWL